MNKLESVKMILGDRALAMPLNVVGKAFAPTNIALCKYWGKRDAELNLPVTPSLSLSLQGKGATCTIACAELALDLFTLNGSVMDLTSAFSIRLARFLDLYRTPRKLCFRVDMQMNIPIAAGLASSACGFASLVLALNNLFGWELTNRELSILARLGSGSACRSIDAGFVEWHMGAECDGLDSYAEPLLKLWPDLCVGLVIVSASQKPMASREAMERTMATSMLYAAWPMKVSADLVLLKQAIAEEDFQLLGATAESNALNMHALMLSAWPPISYAVPETIAAMHKVWQCRQEGLGVYFTQDAGPNLKLLFMRKDQEVVGGYFPTMEVV